MDGMRTLIAALYTARRLPALQRAHIDTCQPTSRSQA
jgi:hypothetical protein